jgi:hypothetical protein
LCTGHVTEYVDGTDNVLLLSVSSCESLGGIVGFGLFESGLEVGDGLLCVLELGFELNKVFSKGLRLRFELCFLRGSRSDLLSGFLNVAPVFLDSREGLDQRLPVFDEGQEVCVTRLLGTEGYELESECLPLFGGFFEGGLERLKSGVNLLEGVIEGGQLLLVFSEERLTLSGLQQSGAGLIEVLPSSFLPFEEGLKLETRRF